MASVEYSRLSAVEARVNKHDKDLYEGNGKPSLCTRMELVEELAERMSRNISKGIWLLVGTFLSSIATITVAVVLLVLRMK